MRQWIFRLLAVIFAMVLVGVGTSFIMFLFDQLSKPKPRRDLSLYQKSPLPGLPYEHIPGASGEVSGFPIKINSLGFRGKEISLEKPKGVIRIVMLGDSIIFGQGVSDQDSLPALLENFLNSGAEERYQVINAGVRGYNTVQEVLYFQARVAPLKPDGVILGITEIDDLDLKTFRYQNPGLEKLRASFWWKIAPVRIFFSWRAQEDYLRASREYIRGLYDPSGEPWKRFVEAISELKEQCQENGAWLLVISFPLLEDQDTFAQERKQLHQKLTELGIPYLDPQPALQAYSWRELVVSNKDLHPNAKAQRIFAELLYDKLKALGYISSD